MQLLVSEVGEKERKGAGGTVGILRKRSGQKEGGREGGGSP